MTEELAIVVGTTNTMIYMPGNGIVLSEPTKVAYNGDPTFRRVRAVGSEAAAMLGKVPEKTVLSFPVVDGFIVEPDACQDMLREFLKKILKPKLFAPKLRALVGVPVGLTLEEKRIYEDVYLKAGLHEVMMLENILLSAVGVDLPVHTHKVSLIINIGGGTTEIAAVSLSGIIKAYGLNIGGAMMDRAIRDSLLGKYGLQLGMSTVSKVKEEIGTLYSNDKTTMSVAGTDVMTKAPIAKVVKSTDIMDAIMPYYLRIADAVERILKMLPTESATDIKSNGVHLTGGCSKILGLEKLFYERLQLPVTVYADGEYSAVLGAGKLLENPVLLNEIVRQKY